jgi:excisionase family DNA binding protein
MRVARLALVPISDERSAMPAAMHELAAARYLGMNRTAFRELLMAGLIPYSRHVNGRRRIFLRADLDAYLENLSWNRMVPRENSQAAPKGVLK